MKREDEKYKRHIRILERELVPAMGCTEPIAIAYAAAYAKNVLEGDVRMVKIYASGNVIKNVKSVTVPNTGGQKGIAAAAIGIAAGRPELKLEVISEVTQSGIEEMKRLLSDVPFEIYRIQGNCALDLAVELLSESGQSKVRIRNTHENIVLVEKNGESVFKSEEELESEDGYRLEMKEIYDFAMSVELDDVKEILQRQIDYNYAIAKEGLKGGYGAAIGRVLLDTYGDSPENRAKALAAAGSDARMGGCELPVIINSGSGN